MVDRIVAQVAGNGFTSANKVKQSWRSKLADDRISSFYEPAVSVTTLVDDSGTARVSAINDFRIGYGIDATQGTMSLRPAFLQTGGPIGRPAMQFTDVGGTEELLADVDPNLSGTTDFGALCVFYSPPNAGNTFGLIGSDQALDGRVGLRRLSSGNLVFNVGTNGVGEATPNVAMSDNTWTVGIGSWSNSLKRAMVRVLGGATDSDTDALAYTADNSVYIGRGCRDVKIALAVTFKVDIMGGDHDDLYADMVQYVAERFGLEY